MTFYNVTVKCQRCGDNYIWGSGGAGKRKSCPDCYQQTNRDPVRSRARSAVAYAVKTGALPSPKTLRCKDCGAQAFCYDHRDYYQPLNVDPVCKRCDKLRGAGYPPLPNKYGSRNYAIKQAAA